MFPERIVDFHIHVGFSTNYAVHPPRQAIETMRGAGVAGAVIFPFECGTQGNYRASNDRVLGAARRWPGFCPFARVGTRDLDASLEELARAVKAGARGLKIHPLFDKVDPKAPETRRLLEAARAHALPVLVHTNRGENSLPKDWAPHIRELPEIPFILGHAGFYDYRSALEVICTHPNAYVETSLCSDLMLAKIVEFGPPARVLFGSDYPYGDIRTSADCLRANVVRIHGDRAAPVLRAIFHDNAERLLGRTFDVPLPPPDPEPELAVPAELLADGARIPCTVYQLSDENCSLRLAAPDAAPGAVRGIALHLPRGSIETAARFLFGTGDRWSVGFVAPPPEVVAGIVAFHLEHQDGARS